MKVVARTVVAVCALSALCGSTLTTTHPAAQQQGASAEIAVAQRWEWPVDPPRVVQQPFRAPETAYSAGHRGIDLEQTPASAVLAPADGVVHFVGFVVDRPVLSIRHDGDLLSAYEPVITELAEGDIIRAGEVIGTVATGGHCDGGCVHFGVRLHGEYVSPLLLLGGIPRAVLLPLG